MDGWMDEMDDRTLTRVEEALENLQANYAADRNQFQRRSLQRGGGREIHFPFEPEPVQNDLQLLQICRLYERSTVSSRKTLIKRLILLGSPVVL